MSAVRITHEWLIAFVRETAIGVVATVSASGAPEAALVGIAATDLGDLLFNTEVRSRKFDNLTRQASIAVVISAGEISVQLEGLAEILDGDSRQECAQIYETQFPDSRAMADNFALVRVRPRWLRYYDARPSSHEVIEEVLHANEPTPSDSALLRGTSVIAPTSR